MSEPKTKALTRLPSDGPTVPARSLERPTDEVIRLMDAMKDKNLPVEALEKLVTLHERMSERQAAQEFAEALARFQQACPMIRKARRANIASSGGAGFSYRYAALEDIAATVQPILHGLGFSYSWDTEVNGKMMTARCTLRHINGHAVTSSFTAPTETRAGMSEQQKYGSALMYAKRQTLIDVLGLTTCDPETPDTPPPGALEPLTEDQAANIDALIEETGANRARFLKLYGAQKVGELSQHNYGAALAALEDKRRNG